MTNRRRWLYVAAGVATILVVAGVILVTRQGSPKARVSLTGAGAAAAGVGAGSSSSTSSTVSTQPNTSSTSARTDGTSGTTATSGVATSTSSANPPTPGPLLITESDNGKSFIVHKGQEIDVQLSAQSVYTWSEPESSDDVVVHRVRGSGGDAASATFDAITAGKADITARHDPKCYPQCKAPTFLFAVHITVIA